MSHRVRSLVEERRIGVTSISPKRATTITKAERTPKWMMETKLDKANTANPRASDIDVAKTGRISLSRQTG
jgi:hypothetical protein